MAAAPEKGRPQQRLRTRKDLLQAASRLTKQGQKPTLEAVAAEALVSRATAYRYFPDIDALLAEAALDVEVPAVDELFAGAAADPVERLERVDEALDGLITGREPQMRVMLAQSLTRALEPAADDAPPARQNRRTPLIEAALAPARAEFTPAAQRRLAHALGLLIGTESYVAARDVLGLDAAEARRVKRWAIRALVDAARKSPRG